MLTKIIWYHSKNLDSCKSSFHVDFKRTVKYPIIVFFLAFLKLRVNEKSDLYADASERKACK